MTALRSEQIGAVELARRLRLAHPPTAEQVAVVEAPLEPLLVIAGAGSGKTETMAARVVWLVANGHVRADEVLGLTFTRKAAGELSERIAARLRTLRRSTGVTSAMPGQDRPRIATYNSYAGALVADHGLRLGVDPEAQLLGEAGRWQLAACVVEGWLGDLATDATPATVIRAVLELSGSLAEHLLTPTQAASELEALARSLLEREASGRRRSGGPRASARTVAASLRAKAGLMELVEEFERLKNEHGVLDFADQVALACRVAREVPEVRRAERARYKVVLLDEYQDTSVAQVELLAALFGDSHPVTAVGDPHQAIYGWRGASVGAIERFTRTFPRCGAGADLVPARVATLATSWRNDGEVLAAANRLADSLRGDGERLGDQERSGDVGHPETPSRSAPAGPAALPVLVPRPGAGPGEVVGFYAETVVEECRRMAEMVADRWSSGVPTDRVRGGDPRATVRRPTTAVLCRARSQMPLVAEALRAAGLPVEVVGLGGLLGTPEVRDLHAALLVAHDPSRSDAAMRLLTGLRLGISDLDVLAEYARTFGARPDVGARSAQAPAAAGEVTGPEASLPDEAASIVDALDRPPRAGWATRRGRSMSPVGQARVTALGATLRAVRAQAHLPVPELVAVTERMLGLDIEVLTRPGADPRHARRHLDAFTEAAADFARGAATPTLGAFLAWLEAADQHERGLDTIEVEPDPTAVQVLTVHAAKGLEWDVVAVPGMAEGAFPNHDGAADPARTPRSSGWLTALADLPYPLRGDADDLPALDLETPVDHKEMADELESFRSRCGGHGLAEERRLAYVAVTRARSVLVLSGAWWKDGAKGSRPPSRFLGELARAGILEPDASWQAPSTSENPLVARRSGGIWPTARSADEEDRVRRAVQAVRGASARLTAGRVAPAVAGRPDPSPTAERWRADAGLLLAEQDSRARVGGDVALPSHLSASAVVRLVADPGSFALERRRPVPVEPTVRARRGTHFHAWVEQFFGAASLIDVEDLSGADDLADGGDRDLEELRGAFLASPWATRRPIAVEVDLETPVGDVTVRCRVDAVFETPSGVEIVDWKTGGPARSRGEARARQMQLAVYRLAWARLHDIPLDTVGARFVHVGHGVEVPAEPMAEAEIVATVTGTFRGRDGPPPGSRP